MTFGVKAVIARDENGSEKIFRVRSRLDSLVEIKYYQNGGILHTVLRNMITKE